LRLFHPPAGEARVPLKKEQTSPLSAFAGLDTDTRHYLPPKKSVTEIDRKLPLGEHIGLHFGKGLWNVFSMI